MQRLPDLFAKRDDPYAGVDLANVSRFGAALWILGGILTALMLPFVPPDDAIGDAGWFVAAAVVAGALVFGVQMKRAGEHARVDELLVYSYGAIAAIAAMVWLSGGTDSPYQHMFLISSAFTCAVHPPRRAFPYLLVFTALALAPLAYADYSGREAIELGFQAFIWLLLSLIVMALMAGIRAQRLGLRREGDQARQQARRDPLTSLLNRRAFDEELAAAVQRAQTTHEPLCVLIGDIDGFKDFNDRFGHLEGDRVLKMVADSLRSALRRPDAAYRWGGDEFAVILPDVDTDGAEHVAERVRAAVRRTRGPDDEPIGMATGVAELDRAQRHPAEALLRTADAALMRAKAADAFDVPPVQG